MSRSTEYGDRHNIQLMNFTLEHDIVEEEQQSFTPLWVTTARTNSFKALRDLLQLRAHALRGGWECHICCIGFMCSKSTYTIWEAVRCRVHQMNLYISYSGEKKNKKKSISEKHKYKNLMSVLRSKSEKGIPECLCSHLVCNRNISKSNFASM